MLEKGDEDSKCAALRSVLSEMVASETSETTKDIFDVEDSVEDHELTESQCWTTVGREMDSGVNCGFHQLGVSSKSTKYNLLLQNVL